jgi:hypothetical protein
MRKEVLDYDDDTLKRKVKNLQEARIRQSEGHESHPRKDVAQAAEAEQVSQDKGEKWSPLNESDDESQDVQSYKDKVFSEYLDTVKARATQLGDGEKSTSAYHALRDSEKSSFQRGDARNRAGSK